MAPKKHSTGPISDFAPPAKMSKAANDFPLFDDGDVAICVGNLVMKLHSKTLRDNCDYFASFERLPNRFVLNPDTNSSMTSYMVVPATSDDNDDNGGGLDTPASKSTNSVSGDNTPKVTRKDALAANETVFRLLYRKPISCATPASFYGVTALARKYGCINAIKDDLITALLRVSLGTQIFRDDPDLLLYTGYHLRDKAIFTEALVHTVGQRKCDSGYLPGNVKGLVAKGVTELENKVGECWKAAMRHCTANSIRSALSATLIRQYIDKHIPCMLGSPLRTEVYQALEALYRMEEAKLMVDFDLISEADTFHRALDVANDSFSNNYNDYGLDERRDTEYCIGKGFELLVSREGVVEELEFMWQQIKAVIMSLFEGDRNVGYFTCFQFKGPFPWEGQIDGSRNGIDA